MRQVLYTYLHQIKDVEFIYGDHEQTYLSILYVTVAVLNYDV